MRKCTGNFTERHSFGRIDSTKSVLFLHPLLILFARFTGRSHQQAMEEL
jgi:hypothetical protein